MPCKVKTLMDASFAVYEYDKPNRGKTRDAADPKKRTPDAEEYAKKEALLAADGYRVSAEFTTDARKGKSNLGAALYVPEDDHEPLIIAYRGTAGALDVRTDINLTLTGTIGNTYRSEAYAFYQRIREQYPNREIVLTGHSLGGHIAQYVGAKALSMTADRQISVRTFNSAAIKTIYQKGIEKNPALSDRFVNYRLEGDPVSMAQNRIGNVYSFPLKTGASSGDRRFSFGSHTLMAMDAHFPPDILEHPVHSKHGQCLLEEKIMGYQYSYQCKVNAQFFPGLRGNIKRNALLQQGLTEVRNLLAGNGHSPRLIDLQYAAAKLHLLRAKLPDGSHKERKMLDIFIYQTNQIASTLGRTQDASSHCRENDGLTQSRALDVASRFSRIRFYDRKTGPSSESETDASPVPSRPTFP